MGFIFVLMLFIVCAGVLIANTLLEKDYENMAILVVLVMMLLGILILFITVTWGSELYAIG